MANTVINDKSTRPAELTVAERSTNTLIILNIAVPAGGPTGPVTGQIWPRGNQP